MDKQYKAFYDMAYEYHVAATSLWIHITDAPYLYNPVLYLLRHTLELQLKGLIVFELSKADGGLKINEINVPSGRKMNSIHSIKTLWDYYQQLLVPCSALLQKSRPEFCNIVINRIDKIDFSSTRYRYPFTKEGSSINLEPVKISADNIASDIRYGIPSVISDASGTKNIVVLKKGKRLIKEVCEIMDVVDYLFECYPK